MTPVPVFVSCVTAWLTNFQGRLTQLEEWSGNPGDIPRVRTHHTKSSDRSFSRWDCSLANAALLMPGPHEQSCHSLSYYLYALYLTISLVSFVCVRVLLGDVDLWPREPAVLPHRHLPGTHPPTTPYTYMCICVSIYSSRKVKEVVG